MHELIASPFLGDHLVLRPGSARGLRIAETRFLQLQRTPAGDPVPGWLVDGVRRCWGLELAGRPRAGTVLVRGPSHYGYGRASYELNLGCNYDCEHCYLGLKKFEGCPGQTGSGCCTCWPRRGCCGCS